jgi:hypothetical protein
MFSESMFASWNFGCRAPIFSSGCPAREAIARRQPAREVLGHVHEHHREVARAMQDREAERADQHHVGRGRLPACPQAEYPARQQVGCNVRMWVPLRWRHPLLGLIMQGKSIGELTTSVTAPLTDAVLSTALAQVESRAFPPGGQCQSRTEAPACRYRELQRERRQRDRGSRIANAPQFFNTSQMCASADAGGCAATSNV